MGCEFWICVWFWVIDIGGVFRLSEFLEAWMICVGVFGMDIWSVWVSVFSGFGCGLWLECVYVPGVSFLSGVYFRVGGECVCKGESPKRGVDSV